MERAHDHFRMELTYTTQDSQMQLQTAMKAVGRAIQLDSNGNDREAYLHYLSCMQFISQCLLQDARTKISQPTPVNLKTKTIQMMVKLAHQCSERVADIMSNMEEKSAPVAHLNVPQPHMSASLSPSPPPFVGLASHSMPVTGRLSPSMFPTVPSALSQSVPTHVAVVRPTVQRPDHQSVTVPSTFPAWQSDDTLGPLEKAYRENRKLMAAYKSRLNRMQTGKNKALVNLTFQRRLMENMAIAKAREASLAKKIKERQQRLQEQAAQRFSSSGQPTREEMELRTVYAQILEYENVKTWLQEWRPRLQEAPEDLALIHDLVTEILSCDEHPLTQLLKRYQITIYHKIMPLIQKELPSIEEIVVPYKDVVPLELQEPRAVPEDGFTTPDELDEGMDEMLAKRLHALRENSTSSADSEASDFPRFGRSNSILFTPNEMSDDVLDELLSEGDSQFESTEVVNGKMNPIVGKDDGPCTTSGVKRVEAGDKCHCDGRTADIDNGHDLGVENGVVPSRTEDEPPVSRTTYNSAEIHTVNNDVSVTSVDEDDIGSGLDEMKNVIGQVKEDVEQAISEGEKLRKKLEAGESVAAVNESRISSNSTTDGDCSSEHVNGGVAPVGDNTKSSDVQEGRDGDGRDDDDEIEGQCQKCERGEGGGNGEESDIVGGEEGVGLRESKEPVSEEGDREGGGKGEEPKEKGEEPKEKGVDSEEKVVAPKEKREDRIAEMKAEALERHLKNISKDVLMFTERLLSVLVAAYEQLNRSIAKEQCIAVIEAFFFKDIWQPLIMLFRRFNHTREKSAAIAMTKYKHALPQHIGVHEKFCLLKEGALQGGCQSATSCPFQPAIKELCNVQSYSCPLEKLECIVKVSKVIIECVEDFYESQGKPRQSSETTVGCDDLLPILSYVIIKSSLPQLVSECSAMEEFIHEGYLFGEEGYCLTTCQTALSYVLKLGSTEDHPR